MAALNLLARSTSGNVTALLHGLGGATNGGVRVETHVLSVGVSFVRGDSHVTVFAGEDWLEDLQLRAAAWRESRAGLRGR